MEEPEPEPAAAAAASPASDVPATKEVKSKNSGSVMVYTASGLAPILPEKEDNESDSEIEDGFESSTWMDQPRVQVMPMDTLNKLRGVTKRPLPGPSEYKIRRANSQVLIHKPVISFGGPLCEINRDKTSKLAAAVTLSLQKPGPGSYMKGGHTPFKDTDWGGFPSRKSNGTVKMGRATRDEADRLSSVPHHKSGSVITPGPGAYRRFWQRDKERACRFSFGKNKHSWLGVRGLDPFKHKHELQALKRNAWWEITDRQRKLMDPGSAFYHVKHKQVRKQVKMGRFGKASRFGNTYGEHFFASFQ